MAGSLPALIDFHEKHKSDRFEIIAFHESHSIESLEDLDKELPPIRTKYWRGGDLPFPVFLDDHGYTVGKFGIHGFPSGILIDPNGILVARGHPEALAQALTKKLGLPGADSRPDSRVASRPDSREDR